MKKILLVLLLSCSFLGYTQKVKLKKGKVYVDKKERLSYEQTKLGTVYKTLDGTPIFRLKKESITKANPNKNSSNSADDDVVRLNDQDANTSDPIRRGNRYKKAQKIRYHIVSYYSLKVEFETTLSASKIIREFYAKRVLMEDGLFNPSNAEIVARNLAQNISGKRKL